MDNSISVLIADDNVELGKTLNEYLGSYSGFLVKGVALDGLQAVEMISAHLPDVVILDLVMPNLDGIGVLERLAALQLKNRPVFIVLTAVGQDGIIQKAIKLGAEYYMVKPFDPDMLVKRIIQLHNERLTGKRNSKKNEKAADVQEDTKNRLEACVTGLIMDMGILPNAAGFHYLREAVVISVESPAMLVSTTRNIYPVIADRHNTTVSKVSRAIKGVIENSSKEMRKTEEKKSIPSFNFGKKAPSNTETIVALAEKAKHTLQMK